MGLSLDDAVAELVAEAVRMARESGARDVNTVARKLLQQATAVIREDALTLTLTPVGPISTPGAELRKVWVAWYLDLYGEVYEWGAKEAMNAKRLMARAAEKGC